MFGRKKFGVATPPVTVSEPDQNSRDTVTPPSLTEFRPTSQAERVIADLVDEITWLKERFLKLQNRVTAELREIRREQDAAFEQEEEDDGYR